jgi:hypothetical protein
MFRDAIRGETWRPNGDSLQAIIADTGFTLRGCYEHIKHSIRATFPTIAGRVRMRHRCLSGKRARRHRATVVTVSTSALSASLVRRVGSRDLNGCCLPPSVTTCCNGNKHQLSEC